MFEDDELQTQHAVQSRSMSSFIFEFGGSTSKSKLGNCPRTMMNYSKYEYLIRKFNVLPWVLVFKGSVKQGATLFVFLEKTFARAMTFFLYNQHRSFCIFSLL